MDLVPFRYDWETAATCARLADLAYADSGECVAALMALGCESRWYAWQSSVGYLAWNDRHGILAFRGTVDVADLLDDGDVRMMTAAWPRAKVHSGFWAHTMRILPRIERDLMHGDLRSLLTRTRRWFVTGHSLGAASAVLAARHLRQWLGDNGSALGTVGGVYLFGCPRVGNRRYTRGYDLSLGDRTYPHRNNNDPVPWVPWQFGRFRHVARGNTRYYTHEGRVIVAPTLVEILRDGRRGVCRAVAETAWDAVQRIPQAGYSPCRAVWAALRDRLSEFDHSLSEYIRLADTQVLLNSD